MSRPIKSAVELSTISAYYQLQLQTLHTLHILHTQFQCLLTYELTFDVTNKLTYLNKDTLSYYQLKIILNRKERLECERHNTSQQSTAIELRLQTVTK